MHPRRFTRAARPLALAAILIGPPPLFAQTPGTPKARLAAATAPEEDVDDAIRKTLREADGDAMPAPAMTPAPAEPGAKTPDPKVARRPSARQGAEARAGKEKAEENAPAPSCREGPSGRSCRRRSTRRGSTP